MIYHGIDGWLDPPMVEVFREQVKQAKDGAVFVELGTYLGKSAACIAELIRDSGKAIRFYTVDDYRDHPMIPPHTLSQTVENLANCSPGSRRSLPRPTSPSRGSGRSISATSMPPTITREYPSTSTTGARGQPISLETTTWAE